MVFILVLLAIAIGLAIGRKYSPKSKLHKYLIAILLPIISGTVIALSVAALNNSSFDFWYKLGQAMAPVIFVVVAMIITLLVGLKVKDNKNDGTKPIGKKVQNLHYGTDENRVDFEMELTEREIDKMEELRRREPKRWQENDLELVKAAKKELLDGDSVQEEVVREILNTTEIQAEASNSKEESQHEEQLVDEPAPETKTDVKPTLDNEEAKVNQSTLETQAEVKHTADKKEKKKDGNTLSKWLKILLIIILLSGILFGLSVLASFIYTKYVYPSKAKSDDERLIQEATANPSKAYDIAQVLFDREENGHQSEYHDFISSKQGVCDLDHTKAGMEVANIYCQYCVDSAKRDITHSAHIARDMLFYKLNGFCNDLFIKTGVEIIKNGAEKGDSISQFAFGCYYAGLKFNIDGKWDDYHTIDGGNIDRVKAAYWYLQSANQGYSNAMGNLGDAYMNGYGVSRDERKGLELIQKAADNGNAFFQRVLGDYYMDGIIVEVGSHKVVTGYYWDWDDDEYGNFGKHKHANTKTVSDYKTILAPDIKQAQYWWKIAADNGDEDAKERLQRIYE